MKFFLLNLTLIAFSVTANAQSIAYPANRTFDMSSVKGQTYITFLKQKLKPTLDGLSNGFPNIGSAAFKAHITPVHG